MQDTIPISVDERRFTIWEWLHFLTATTFFTYFTLFVAVLAWVTLAIAWRNVWFGDFTQTDLIWAIGLTILSVSAWAAVYAMMLQDVIQELGLSRNSFTRGSVQIDPRSGRLILKVRHITGLSRQKSLSFADIRDIGVTWQESKDGKKFLQLALTPRGSPIHPAITTPADAANLPAFEARLRAALVAAGWSDPRRLWMSTR